MTDKKVVHLLSGGMDSVVLLYRHLEQQSSVHCLFFDYGQNHRDQELKCARFHSEFRGVTLDVLKLPKIKGSTLTGGVGSKVVPNRNAIFISVAISVAVNLGSELVTIGCNQDDAADFPDCRKEFIDAINDAKLGKPICLNTTGKLETRKAAPSPMLSLTPSVDQSQAA